jgi:peptide/nickel transport system substrate-binding protein
MAGNRSFYSNPEVDKLLDAAKNETDQEKRKELYERIQLIIVDEAPEVMLYNRVLSVGAQKNIEGFNMHPVTLHDFYPIYVK